MGAKWLSLHAGTKLTLLGLSHYEFSLFFFLNSWILDDSQMHRVGLKDWCSEGRKSIHFSLISAEVTYSLPSSITIVQGQNSTLTKIIYHKTATHLTASEKNKHFNFSYHAN